MECQLKGINFSGTELSTDQLSQIAQASTLQTLTLVECGMTDVSPLSALPLIESFDVRDNELASIETAAFWLNLRTLRLNRNPLTSLAGLEMHEVLREVDITGTMVDDLTPLVVNETFRTGDELIAEDTALDEGDCGDIAVIRERMGVVTTDVACP